MIVDSVYRRSTEPTDSQGHSCIAPQDHPLRVNHHIPSFSVRYRHGGLSSHQHQLWEQMWPDYGVDLLTRTDPSGHSARYNTIRSWCEGPSKVILDIGCGSGISTIEMANQHPEYLIVAVEVYQRGIAQLLAKIADHHSTNIRIIYGDAYQVLSNYLTQESLSAVCLFFPDPWPKKRHHKRRFLQPDSVGFIIKTLHRYGILHIATDHTDYAEHIRQVCSAYPQLHQVQQLSDPSLCLLRPVTKYEAKGRSAGHIITDMIWEKS